MIGQWGWRIGRVVVKRLIAVAGRVRPPVASLKPGLGQAVPAGGWDRKWYGSELSGLVAAAELNPEPRWSRQVYRTIKPEFDIPFYLSQYPDVCERHLDPVDHYIRVGAKEGRDPSPQFSTRTYRRRYPEVRRRGLNPFYHWVTEGREKGYLPTPFQGFEYASRMQEAEAYQVQAHLDALHTDLRQRLESGELGRMVAKAAELDPLVAQSWPQALNMRIPPFHNKRSIGRLAMFDFLLHQAERRRAGAVVVTERFARDHWNRLDLSFVRALAARHGAGEVVVISTDPRTPAKSRALPTGVRHVVFGAGKHDVPDVATNRLESNRILLEFVRSLGPEVVVNAGSARMTAVLRGFGTPLSKSSRVVECVYGDDRARVGDARRHAFENIYRQMDFLTALCTDCPSLERDLRASFALPPEIAQKVHYMPTPPWPLAVSPPSDKTAPAGQRAGQVARQADGGQGTVIWAGPAADIGELSRVVSVARALAHVQFQLYRTDEAEWPATGRWPDNVHAVGDLRALSSEVSVDAWLQTGAPRTLPGYLLDAGGLGIPLVLPESLCSQTLLTPRLVQTFPDTAKDCEIAACVEAAIGDRAGAVARGAELSAAIQAARSEEHFKESLARILDPVAEPA